MSELSNTIPIAQPSNAIQQFIDCLRADVIDENKILSIMDTIDHETIERERLIFI